MPLAVDENLPTKFPNPDYLTLDNFKRGVITLINRSRTPRNALVEADNIVLVEDGQPAVRPGIAWFGSSLASTVKVTDWKSATAASSTGSWSGATNIFTSDDTYATITATGVSSALRSKGHGFNLPPTAIVTQMEVRIEGNGPGATATTRQLGVNISTNGTGTAGTFTTFQLNQTTDTEITNTIPLGGYVLTGAIANDTNFGANIVPNLSADSGVRNIDRVQIRLTYTFDGGIDGYDYYDAAGVIHIVVAHGGYIYRSVDNAVTWELCTGATLTAGTSVNMNQYNAFLYITNGVNDIIRYNGTTTLQVYNTLTTPATITSITPTAGLTGTGYTVYYKIAAVNAVGFSAASTAYTQVVNAPRDQWDKTTNNLSLTLPAPQTGQERYDIFYSDDNVNFYYLDSIVSSPATPSVTYKDTGTAVLVVSTTAPTTNTTLGPKVAELVNVGARMFGVRDPSYRYRIWFTSGKQPYGAFTNAYDGGYLDWQPGGKYFPVQVADYRDGKGSPTATVWCDSSDGQGCILQMTLDDFTIQDITVTIPSAYKLPGSRGTPAPGSVLNVLNDYMFYNSQAIYNLGSRPQLLQVLSTDETSANIRPNVKQISSNAENGIASVYYDARAYFSVPYGTTQNSHTIIYDTERKAWLPKAFTVGFKKFLRYTAIDGTGNKTHKLLALKPGDNQLSEIGENIQGDYGVAFQTSLTTGLYSVSKNRFEFQFTEEAEMEFSDPRGYINVELIGNDRAKGYSSIKTVPISNASSVNNTGWDTTNWDISAWDNTSVVPTVISKSSDQRYTSIQRELSAVQWHITTNSVDANYVLRTLQTWGTPTEGGHPSSWRLK